MSHADVPRNDGAEPASLLDLTQVRDVVVRAEQRARDLQVLQTLGIALSRSLDEGILIAELVRGLQRATGEADALVALVDPETGELRLRSGGVAPYAESFDETILSSDGVRSALLDGKARTVVVGGHTVVVAPMKHASRLVGAVIVRESGATPNAEREELIQSIAIQAGAALRNAQLYTESERERRQSDAMADVARAVGESLRTGEVMRRILRHAMALLRAEGAFISLREGDYLAVQAALGSASVLAGVMVPVDASVGGASCLAGDVVISNNAESDHRMHTRLTSPVRIERIMAAPLLSAGGAIGTIECINRSELFNPGDARVLRRLADQVSVAVLNARLFEDVQAATREWSQTFDSIGVGMAVVNEDGCIVRCNTRARQLSDAVLPLALVGQPIYDAVLGVRPPIDQDPVHMALHEGVESHCVLEGIRDGQPFQLNVRAAPHPIGAVVTFSRVDVHAV